MSNGTHRDQWVAAVLRSTALTDAVRVLLLALALRMDEDGTVEMRRKDAAEWLARSEKRITERLTAAIDSGYLVRVSRGQRNGPGRYRAVLPGPVLGTPGGTEEDYPQGYPQVVFGTPGGVEEKSLGDGLQVQEKSSSRSLRDPRGGRRTPTGPNLFGTPGGVEEPAPSKGTARAPLDGDRHLPTPVPTGTHTPAPSRTETKVSQSARKREALRLLNRRYGLTEFEAAAVLAEVAARAPEPIRMPARYLDRMAEGDLADIVAAIQTRTTPDEPAQPQDDQPTTPAPARTPWCGHCESDTYRWITLLDGRAARCPTCNPHRAQETA